MIRQIQKNQKGEKSNKKSKRENFETKKEKNFFDEKMSRVRKMKKKTVEKK